MLPSEISQLILSIANTILQNIDSAITSRIVTAFTNSDEDVPSSKLVKNSIDTVSGNIPTGSSTDNDIQMDGTKSAGNSSSFARANHVHPTDTSRAASSHTHGNLQNNGQIGLTAQANKNVVTDGEGKIITENKPTIPIASSTDNDIQMNGTKSAGNSDKFARANHVHPTDTSRAAATHEHQVSDITDFPQTMTPSSHKSSSTTYGVGDSSNYGHLKLDSTVTTNGENPVTGGGVKDYVDTAVANVTNGTIDLGTTHNHDDRYIKDATGTVTSTNILNGTIVNDDIANTTITGGKLVNKTITSTQLGDTSVTLAKLNSDVYDSTNGGTSGSSKLITSGAVYNGLAGKVSTVSGKGLSTNDFTNTYKTALDNLNTTISTAVSNLEMIEVVSSLPTTNIATNKLYVKSNGNNSGENRYDIYIYVNNNWEKIDSLDFSINDYIKKDSNTNLVLSNGTTTPQSTFVTVAQGNTSDKQSKNVCTDSSGNITLEAKNNHTHNYAASGHDHDGTYEKLSNKINDWEINPISDANKYPTAQLVDGSLRALANQISGHNHNSTYVAIAQGSTSDKQNKNLCTDSSGNVTLEAKNNHTHNYAASGHDHDGTYVKIAQGSTAAQQSKNVCTDASGNVTLEDKDNHTHKVGSNENYFVVTTTNGALTSKSAIGNIDINGAIGQTSGRPIRTTTNGVLETGYERIVGGTIGGTKSAFTATVTALGDPSISHGRLIALYNNINANDAGATLKVGNLAAKPIYYKNSAITAGQFPKYSTALFMYNTDSSLNSGNGVWQMIYAVDTNTNVSHTHGALQNGGTISSAVSSLNNIVVTDTSNNIKTSSTLPLSKIADTETVEVEITYTDDSTDTINLVKYTGS